jgi:alanine dehydrogenase
LISCIGEKRLAVIQRGFAMLVDVPKETKGNEYRVGIVPSTVRELTEKGHQVVVEAGAGLPDGNYRPRRSYLMPIACMARAELIVKVKEPLPTTRKELRPGQGLATGAERRPAFA